MPREPLPAPPALPSRHVDLDQKLPLAGRYFRNPRQGTPMRGHLYWLARLAINVAIIVLALLALAAIFMLMLAEGINAVLIDSAVQMMGKPTPPLPLSDEMALPLI